MPLWRIRDRATFIALREQGRRARRGPVKVTFVVGDPTANRPRVAFAVPRRAGGAVERNRIRRRLRAAMTDLAPPPGAYLVSADADAATVDFDELRTRLSDAVDAAVHGPAAPSRHG